MITIDMHLSALSHPARRSALRLLAGEEEHCLCELMEKLAVSQSSMSRHMATLKEVGLITDRRDAQWMRYRLRVVDDPVLQAVVSAILAVDETKVGLLSPRRQRELQHRSDVANLVGMARSTQRRPRLANRSVRRHFEPARAVGEFVPEYSPDE